MWRQMLLESHFGCLNWTTLSSWLPESPKQLVSDVSIIFCYQMLLESHFGCLSWATWSSWLSESLQQLVPDVGIMCWYQMLVSDVGIRCSWSKILVVSTEQLGVLDCPSLLNNWCLLLPFKPPKTPTTLCSHNHTHTLNKWCLDT